jgi:hypothetical protein
MIERYRTVQVPVRIYREGDELRSRCFLPSDGLGGPPIPSHGEHDWQPVEYEITYHHDHGDMLIRFQCRHCGEDHLEEWPVPDGELKLSAAKPRYTRDWHPPGGMELRRTGIKRKGSAKGPTR